MPLLRKEPTKTWSRNRKILKTCNSVALRIENNSFVSNHPSKAQQCRQFSRAVLLSCSNIPTLGHHTNQGIRRHGYLRERTKPGGAVHDSNLYSQGS